MRRLPTTLRGTLVLAVLVVGSFALAGPFGAPAGAMTRDGVESIGSSTSPVTLASYPFLADGSGTSLFPADSAVDATQVLTGRSFTLLAEDGSVLAGGPGTTDLQDLGNLGPGQTVRMHWTGWADGCSTLISLSVKRTVAPFFDSTTDQALVDFAACAPTGEPSCVDPAGGFTLDLVQPSFAAACNYQFDAAIGPPLEVVGPDGTFYGDGLRAQVDKPAPGNPGPNMLIAANNGGADLDDATDNDCPQPVSTAPLCVAGGAQLTVTNPDPLNDIRVDVLVDGVTVVSQGEVVRSSSQTFTVPMTTGTALRTIEVRAAGRTIFGPAPFDPNCAPPEEPVVAACVTGKTPVERFTATDVYDHLDGEFAVTIDEATGNWTSQVPINFMMVVEDNEIVRSFQLPGNFTSGTFTANTVTVTVDGQPVVIQGVITDANGNPIPADVPSAAAVGGVTSVTYCAGEVASTTTTTPTTTPSTQPAAEVLGVQQTQGVAPVAAAALPRTGGADAGQRLLVALGTVLCGLGVVLFGQERRSRWNGTHR